MKRVRRILALSKKEFLQIKRDRSALFVTLLLPIVLLSIYGAGLSLDAINLRIAIVMNCVGEEGESLADAFRFSPFFLTTTKQDRREFYQEFVDGKWDAIVEIPAEFMIHSSTHQRSANIQLITDGSDPNTATFVRNYIEIAVRNWSTIQQKTKGIQLTPSIVPITRVWFNEELNSRYFLLPGSMVIILTLTGTLLTALVVAKEWEQGTMEALMTTEASMREILCSKFLVYFLLGSGTLIVLYGLARTIFGIPFRGSFLLFFFTACSYLTIALALGILISTVTKNQFAAMQVALFASFMPAFMLSGFLFEINSMPTAIRWLSALLPQKYCVASLQTLFLSGDIYPLLLPNGVILLIYAGGILALCLIKSHHTLD